MCVITLSSIELENHLFGRVSCKNTMSKNLYFPYDSEWTMEQWFIYCPNMEYRLKQQAEFPPFLPPSLTNKFNCGMVAASGNDTNQTFVFQGYRIDESELDEHQYIVTYNTKEGTTYAGFIEHADYFGRTTEIPPEMRKSLSLSGVNVDCHFDRKPPNSSGSLTELISGGLISGFINSVDVQNANEKKA